MEHASMELQCNLELFFTAKFQFFSSIIKSAKLTSKNEKIFEQLYYKIKQDFVLISSFDADVISACVRFFTEILNNQIKNSWFQNDFWDKVLEHGLSAFLKCITHNSA